MARSTQAKRLEVAKPGELRKLGPAELEKIGKSAKSEQYVLKGATVRKGVHTISKREYLKRQTAEREGLTRPISLERAARARREGALRYSSAAAEEQAHKQAEVRLLQRVSKVRYVKDHRGREYKTSISDEYAELRARKLNGDFLDQAEWCAMMDMAHRVKDPMLANLKSSAIVTR